MVVGEGPFCLSLGRSRRSCLVVIGARKGFAKFRSQGVQDFGKKLGCIKETPNRCLSAVVAGCSILFPDATCISWNAAAPPPAWLSLERPLL